MDQPIRFTPAAQAQAERLAAAPEQAGKVLRLYIDGKGCDGFFYGVAFDDRLPDDQAFALGTLTIVVDEKSLQFMAGSVVGWVDDERGQGFLVENPEHKRYRGKFYKRKAWQDKLAPSADPKSSP